MKPIKYVIFILFAFQYTVISANYYIDRNHPSSDDANSGSQELPFKTIQRGVDMAQPGDYKVEWNGRSFASGIYLYRIKTEDGYLESRKMILIK